MQKNFHQLPSRFRAEAQAKPRLSIIGPPSRIGSAASVSWQDLARCSTAQARSCLSLVDALRLRVLPLGLHRLGEQKILSLASSAPMSANLLQELRFITSAEISSELVEVTDLQKAITAAYRGEEQMLKQASSRADKENFPDSKVAISNDLSSEKINDSAIPALLNQIIERAIFLNASDIHIEPLAEGTRLRLRVDGFLREESSFGLLPAAAQSLLRRIKVLAQLDTTAIHTPQEGGFSYRSEAWDVRIRVSVIPQVNGEKIVLRLLHHSFLDSLRSQTAGSFAILGLSLPQEQILRAFLASDRGVMLLSGPTGSGKSTLLYAALLELNAEWRNIVTLEDPVERIIPGINQTEISPALDLGYVQLLPKLLRQDPDVIMIGEVRDAPTLKTALEAGITGSLVLSTVHAGNCLEVFPRLLQLGAEPSLIAASLKLLVSQRLLAKNCPHCIRYQEANLSLQKIFMLPQGTTIASSIGCELCSSTGIAGRVGIFEFLPINDSIRQILSSLGPEAGDLLFRLRMAANENAYQPYVTQVRQSLIRQEISPNSAARAMGLDPHILCG